MTTKNEKVRSVSLKINVRQFGQTLLFQISKKGNFMRQNFKNISMQFSCIFCYFYRDFSIDCKRQKIKVNSEIYKNMVEGWKIWFNVFFFFEGWKI